ncbi:ATP-dependent DNA ligase [Robertkochia marina]|uniref:DNA ligase (ATP) n=1 Tax=Robertkochia marina TaxID=1227945 RepID=A0A4S3M2Z9_9FLAO|nr:ATP-dependent DNA ligase [Robertkochia marina]THD69059.1 ATP-dependent DNA ligase [Robertkochia marina]TRZ44883.1 ATP-dependent DNA ligase [Robertkochia marina]
MKDFALLIKDLDSTNSTNKKVKYLSEYFSTAEPKDRLWTIALLSHRRPKRPVNTTRLREWASELASIPLWLFEESYHIVGDLAETIALVIPGEPEAETISLHQRMEELIALRSLPEEEQKEYLSNTWMTFDHYERFAFTKLLTGGFRIGISQKLMTRALARATEQEEDILAYKLMGNWTPETTTFHDLVYSDSKEAQKSRPYPFYLAYALEDAPDQLGDPTEWMAEYKWDGIRGQLIYRDGEIFVWSRGEELVTDKFPELEGLSSFLPDGVVLDGEILVRKGNTLGSFNDLQKRLGRKTVSKKLLEENPVFMMVYDLLEWEGKDIRQRSQKERRSLLEQLLRQLPDQQDLLALSPLLPFNSWEELSALRDGAREAESEGLMIKSRQASYGVGRKKGDWWKWKVDPLTIDAVLTYAMRGHGRRTNLFTDYTFALWDQGELVTFAKAYSGLSDAEFREVDRFVKKNTTDRFGPVRQVTPELVFEIAFEGIAPSSRHKSGVAVRFPRMLRWRKDKKPEEANTLNDLKAFL